MIVKYKNGKKIVQTTSDQLQNNYQKPDSIGNGKAKKKKRNTKVVKQTVKKPVKKARRKSGCGCGK